MIRRCVIWRMRIKKILTQCSKQKRYAKVLISDPKTIERYGGAGCILLRRKIMTKDETDCLMEKSSQQVIDGKLCRNVIRRILRIRTGKFLFHWAWASHQRAEDKTAVLADIKAKGN